MAPGVLNRELILWAALAFGVFLFAWALTVDAAIERFQIWWRKRTMQYQVVADNPKTGEVIVMITRNSLTAVTERLPYEAMVAAEQGFINPRVAPASNLLNGEENR